MFSEFSQYSSLRSDLTSLTQMFETEVLDTDRCFRLKSLVQIFEIEILNTVTCFKIEILDTDRCFRLKYLTLTKMFEVKILDINR